jgi:hypothetical protein
MARGQKPLRGCVVHGHYCYLPLHYEQVTERKIDANDVAHLLNELRIGRELEGLAAMMRLQREVRSRCDAPSKLKG